MSASRYDGRFPEPPYPEMPPDLSVDLAKAQEEIDQLKGHIQILLEERFTKADRPIGDPEIGLETMRLERDKLQSELNSIWDVIRESHISYDDSLSSAEKIRLVVEQLHEARKAARSIYKSHLTGEFFMDEIANAALAHWPWLEETACDKFAEESASRNDFEAENERLASELTDAKAEAASLRNEVADAFRRGYDSCHKSLLTQMANAGCNCGPNYGCGLAKRMLKDMRESDEMHRGKKNPWGSADSR